MLTTARVSPTRGEGRCTRSLGTTQLNSESGARWDQTLAAQFPLAPAKEMVLQRCSTCHSFKVFLNQPRTEHEREIATFGILGETIVRYITAHFGK